MRRGIILLTVLLLPITIYLIFAVSTIHYVRVPHYGPRSARMVMKDGKEKKDSVYYRVTDPDDPFPMFIALFIHPDSIRNNYNAAALKAYYKVNKGELDTLHFIFFYPCGSDSCSMHPEFADSMGIQKDHCKTICSGPEHFKKQVTEFFISEPGHTDGWKTKADMVLVDTHGYIRGYYDGRYAPEITRMIEDIKHIKFHDEAVMMEERNTPVQKRH
ncbi:MAG TPA: hypothetical protein VNZ86_05900 [Bacteroidia bacterium]|jgi:hypothetical protein|nr:hypothetical protein [Bacteroidia bacterium]